MRSAGASGAPERLGVDYETRLDDDLRRRHGVFYTPAAVARRILDLVLERRPPERPPRVLDPAVGGASFLLAAADRLEREGWSAEEIVRECLFGVDRDPDAVAVAGEALGLWASERGVTFEPETRLVVGDVLRDGLPWANAFDVVVGNPPFLSQLADRTVRDAGAVRAVRERFGDLVTAYTDSAVVFLLTALAACRRGGRVALVLPESFLSARDARPARRHVGEGAALIGLWLADEEAFDASVRVCVPVIEVGGAQPRVVRRWTGPGAGEVDPAPTRSLTSSWSPLVADLLGAPVTELATQGLLGDLCTATAGFRDQYYGIRDVVTDEPVTDGAAADVDDRRHPRLVTSGLVDPFTCRWRDRPVRFAKRRWSRPRVDLDRLAATDARLAAWARARMVPKVVLATQTRVLEAAADADGSWYPLTPTIALEPAPKDLWSVLAVVSAPPISAWAFQQAAGAALARDAVKLSARQALSIPLPARREPWIQAAGLAETLSRRRPDRSLDESLLERFGLLMAAAYGLERHSAETVTAWWLERLPRARRGGNATRLTKQDESASL